MSSPLSINHKRSTINPFHERHRDLGLEPIINATGTVTRLGGAILPAKVLAALEADRETPLEQLQDAASRRIAKITGAEAGLVTTGAAAALTLGTAAILAGNDLARMERLPDTRGMRHEFLVAREQRNGYDHAVRAAGATLVEVGFNEIIAGAGVRRTEAWEYEAAISERTAGILYVYNRSSRPPLSEVAEVAQRHRLPLIVDAAGGLPPRSNLTALITAGADLVCFSGGKGDARAAGNGNPVRAAGAGVVGRAADARHGRSPGVVESTGFHRAAATRLAAARDRAELQGRQGADCRTAGGARTVRVGGV
ncbi:MAG: hypothetical protein U0992_24520 [Planctomycetaceae bacterium]